MLDPLLETVEGLVPDPWFDPSRDPEGEDGRHRQELLPWIFDRHLEFGKKLKVDRGTVEGGEIDFQLEYIGQAGKEALQRATGPHHKIPLILSRTLLYEPDRLVYTLPCDIHAGTHEPKSTEPRFKLSVLAEAVAVTGLPRELLIDAAEEALIAAFVPHQNWRNTGARKFPRSDAGDRLVAQGIENMALVFGGIPKGMTIRTEEHSVDHAGRGLKFRLSPP